MQCECECEAPGLESRTYVTCNAGWAVSGAIQRGVHVPLTIQIRRLIVFRVRSRDPGHHVFRAPCTPGTPAFRHVDT
eukprot:452505-Prymnesium_polylepis.1